jgi:hypothetical protein
MNLVSVNFVLGKPPFISPVALRQVATWVVCPHVASPQLARASSLALKACEDQKRASSWDQVGKQHCQGVSQAEAVKCMHVFLQCLVQGAAGDVCAAQPSL